MAFLPNTDCTVERADAGTDVYGQQSLGAAVTVRIAIVNLEITREKTSVRTDSSASRGNAEEAIATRVRLLFPADFEPKNGDRVTVLARELKVISVFPRLDIVGTLDHHQVDCDVWSQQ